MITAQTLYQDLLRLDQRGYKAYKSIQGQYQFSSFVLWIDYVQGDPFAAPSRLRVIIPQNVAGFPRELYQSRSREIALRDYLTRQFHQGATQLNHQRNRSGSGHSGAIGIGQPSQQVIERSAVWIDPRQLEVRFTVGLPARGRTILGREAAELLCERIPELVKRALIYAALDAAAIQQHVETMEDADWLRQQLAGQQLVAFVADGAVLPRRSGVDERPLPEAIPFRSPEALRCQFVRPNGGLISGMGIPRGITLIVGGGYHGKSTLLNALAYGIYNHIPSDGREQVVTDATAMKIRAEDGRSVVGVNISPFINQLPQGRSTGQFSTANASGSTSQAANIMEALEVGATVLLIDEDTSATNFMIRDRRMQALIAKDKEPITPLIDKIQQLYQELGVSTILVMGGSGDYFEVADTVIAMTEFAPQEVTAAAKTIAAEYATHRAWEGGDRFGQLTARIPLRQEERIQGQRGPRFAGRRQVDAEANAEEARERPLRLKVRAVDELVLGTESIDLSAVEQLVETGQLRAIGAAILRLQQEYFDGKRTLSRALADLMTEIETCSLDCLSDYPQGDLAIVRPLELAAAINRWRSFAVKVESGYRGG